MTTLTDLQVLSKKLLAHAIDVCQSQSSGFIAFMSNRDADNTPDFEATCAKVDLYIYATLLRFVYHLATTAASDPTSSDTIPTLIRAFDSSERVADFSITGGIMLPNGIPAPAIENHFLLVNVSDLGMTIGKLTVNGECIFDAVNTPEFQIELKAAEDFYNKTHHTTHVAIPGYGSSKESPEPDFSHFEVSGTC